MVEETKRPKEKSAKKPKKSGATAEVEEEKKFEHPPPKRPGSAWLYYNTEFCKKFVEDGGEYKLAFKAASDKWNSIAEEEKQPYLDMAEQAKERAEKQKVELEKKGYYTLENGSKSTDEANTHLLKVKKPKAVTKAAAKGKPVATEEDEEEQWVHPPPKRPGSAWLFFNTSYGKKFLEDGGEQKDAFKAASNKWNSLPDEEKQPYHDLAAQAKERVAKQTVELQKKGYYTLENGTKSTDAANAHLLKVKQPRASKADAKSAGAGKSALAGEDEEEEFVHPQPKRPASAWIYFNTSFCKTFVEEGGERAKAFTAAGEKWGQMSEEEK